MPEDRRVRLEEPGHEFLRPDQAPTPSVDDITAVKAVFDCRATPTEQARFTQYLLALCGMHAGEAMMRTDWWAFSGGKRWVAATLLGMAEARLVTLRSRQQLEKPNDD